MAVRIAIIGAGPSGLAQLRSFETLRRQGVEVPEVVCFEKQSNWGGLWNYTWRTGLDEYGEPVHGSMYRYLWSNGPKECWSSRTTDSRSISADRSPPIRPGPFCTTTSWAGSKRAGCAPTFDSTPWFDGVDFDPATRTFTVTVKDLVKDEMRSEKFDYVVVASGHFSTPNVPYFEGAEAFPGRVMHAHDFAARTNSPASAF